MSACHDCSQLHDHNFVTGIQFHLLDGAHKKTPWAFLTVGQMYQAPERKSVQMNKLKLMSLILACKINV